MWLSLSLSIRGLHAGCRVQFSIVLIYINVLAMNSQLQNRQQQQQQRSLLFQYDGISYTCRCFFLICNGANQIISIFSLFARATNAHETSSRFRFDFILLLLNVKYLCGTRIM